MLTVYLTFPIYLTLKGIGEKVLLLARLSLFLNVCLSRDRLILEWEANLFAQGSGLPKKKKREEKTNK